MRESIEDFLHDVVPLLIERAREAKREESRLGRDADPGKRAFTEGRVLAYYEVLSTLFGQAGVFGLVEAGVQLPEFDPDKELLQR
jgi:hypothetical protein